MTDSEVFFQVRGLDGRLMKLYADPDRLQAHLLEISPADALPIKRLCGAVRALADMAMPLKADEMPDPLGKLGFVAWLLPRMGHFLFLARTTLGTFAESFSSPFLQRAFKELFYGMKDMSLIPLGLTLGPMWRKSGGYPEGGSYEFARSMEKRFLELGGKIHFHTAVERVLEAEAPGGGKTAVGLLAGGKKHHADYIISSMDMRHSLTVLLGGRQPDPSQQWLLDHGKLIEPLILVYFGVDMDLATEVGALGEVVELEKPLSVAGRLNHFWTIKNYCHDPSSAPKGKSVVGITFKADWLHWEGLRKDPIAYRTEKEKIRELCLDLLEARYPGFRSKVEASDVATPLSFERYTGNWKGSYMTWNKDDAFRKRFGYAKRTVPGLANFWMASMWTDFPGGLPGAASAGRKVVQLLCRQDRKPFRTEEPS